MLVKELKKILENLNDDFVVALEVQLDSENGVIVKTTAHNVMTIEDTGEEFFDENETGYLILYSDENIL